VILHFVDGQRGDADLVANGEIADPGGPAVCDPASGLAVNFVTAEPTNSIDLTARVSNIGSVPVPAGTTVDFYLGDPNAGGSTTLTTGGSLIGTATTVQPLGTGEFEDVHVTWDGAAEGDHQIFIVADDPAPGQIAECSAGGVAEQTVSILDVPLVESWNLISTYVNPFNTDASVVQRPISGTYVVIQGFDGGAQSYYPDLPPAVNTLKTMDGEHGYWIKVSNQLSVNSEQSTVDDHRSPLITDHVPNSFGLSLVTDHWSLFTDDCSAVATLRVVGEKFAEDRPIELDAGWNLVSYLPRQPLAVRDALQSIEGQYFAVLGFDGGALSFYANLDDSFNTLRTMEPLHGYWIKMVEAGTLQYPVTGDQRSVLGAAEGSEIRELETRDSQSPTSNLQSLISPRPGSTSTASRCCRWGQWYRPLIPTAQCVVQQWSTPRGSTACWPAMATTRRRPRMRARGLGIRFSWWWMVRR